MEAIIEIKNRCEFRLKDKSGYKNRLYEELDWFNSYGGTKALIIASDLIKDLKKSGLFIGSGQSYACCSLVCYGLGITDVNPVIWDLPFVTFKRHFKEKPVFWINTSEGGSTRINEIIKYADYPELVSIDGPSAEINLLDDKSVDTCMYIVNEYPILDMLKSFQELQSANIKKIQLDAAILELIIKDGIDGFSRFSHVRLKERVAEFKPECFSDLCVIEALSRPDVESVWTKVLDAKKAHDVPSTGYIEVDRILYESYGQIIYEEQMDAIKGLANNLGRDKVESVLSDLEINEESLANKGTTIANVYETVQCKAFEMKMPAQYYSILDTLQTKIQEQHIQIIKNVRDRIRHSRQSET